MKKTVKLKHEKPSLNKCWRLIFLAGAPFIELRIAKDITAFKNFLSVVKI